MITFSNFTLLWLSKLHTNVDLSTLNYDYVPLSRSIVDLLPLKNIINEVVENLGIDS